MNNHPQGTCPQNRTLSQARAGQNPISALDIHFLTGATMVISSFLGEQEVGGLADSRQEQEERPSPTSQESWLGGACLAGECKGQLGSLEISFPDHTAASAGGLLIVNYAQFEV